MKKMILEARINEYAMRDQNPNVPWTADEIAESAARCRAEGAAIVHFHARAEDGFRCTRRKPMPRSFVRSGPSPTSSSIRRWAGSRMTTTRPAAPTA